ncbi:hypothetical protein NDU88_002045 [Pleurodeles waltl]|uniref:Uncharacterized protein n=1 Tax=Pleurodeles waltl TaxID=8319 RepID=A0AAV7U9C5_PLEWA|nr:hypothetical protein NDU88_002045 [Pleurodeles waltl]
MGNSGLRWSRPDPAGWMHCGRALEKGASGKNYDKIILYVPASVGGCDRAQETLRFEPLPESPRGSRRSLLPRSPMEHGEVRENPDVKEISKKYSGEQKTKK